ncbi:hypothetical protein [Paraburkholderia adhaesiva]|uniref:hypothetical protein n=1 Tax=Paraburkholderia adhaesiva TaxID=2883244 RepID=UPI001F2C8851|nr:hypothetical protein [Paraburkholderia adhaesiva]
MVPATGEDGGAASAAPIEEPPDAQPSRSGEPDARGEAEEPENVNVVVAPLEPSKTTIQEYETFPPLERDWNPEDVFLVGHASTRQHISAIMDTLPNIDITKTEDGREWYRMASAANTLAPRGDQWQKSVSREGSEWRQGISSEQGRINLGRLSFASAPSEKVSGEKAILQIRSMLGLGAVIQVPLFHSGFHVSIKAPNEMAMLELNRHLMEDKIDLGRDTTGFAFANTSSYLTKWLLDFAIDHLHDTSLQEKDPVKLRELILAPDLPILFWGLACSIWPRGFQYARPYIDPATKEEKILRSRLNVSKLLWVDNKALTAWQVRHMAGRGSSTMSAESVKRYRSEFTIGQPRRVQLTSDIAMTLRVPSAADYVLAGERWIGEIVRLVDRAMEVPPTDEKRNSYILSHGQATNMRQYVHWVQEIHFGAAGSDSGIVDRETLENAINELSPDEEVRTRYFTHVRQYIDDCTIALIGTNTVAPDEENRLPRFPHILPMNVENTFFTLLGQKVSQINQRD